MYWKLAPLGIISNVAYYSPNAGNVMVSNTRLVLRIYVTFAYNQVPKWNKYYRKQAPLGIISNVAHYKMKILSLKSGSLGNYITRKHS